MKESRIHKDITKALTIEVMVKGTAVYQAPTLCLSHQEAQVQSLVREDRTRLGATKPLHHNYQAHPVGSTDANVEPKGCNH